MSKHAPPYPNAATDPFNKVPGMNKPREDTTADVERLAEALRKIAALTEEFDDLDDAVGIANEALERENDDA